MLNSVLKFALMCAVATANAANLDPVAPSIDSAFPSLQIAKLGMVDGLENDKSVRLSLAIVPIVSVEAPFVRRNFGADYQSSVIVVKSRETTWMDIPLSQRQLRRGRISLLPLLRIERSGEQLELRPRLRSVSIEWRKNF